MAAIRKLVPVVILFSAGLAARSLSAQACDPDTTAPQITCPDDISASGNGSATVVNYSTPTASDACDEGPIVMCVPASGSSFAPGSTEVTCTATDVSQNASQCTFHINVPRDTTAPQITCPANITVNVAACSAIVRFSTPVAIDTADPSPSVQCLPASGSSFPEGTTQVTCTATDASQNVSQCTFNITVDDTSVHAMTCPANITQATDQASCDAIVNYPAPTVTGNCGGTVVCAPASGSTFPLGETVVTCTATNGSSQAVQCSFTVTIDDTTPPSIACPEDITKFVAPGVAHLAVTYLPPVASDDCQVASASCVPASGSDFPLGTTQVTCTASDAANNTARCTFAVTVRAETIVPTLGDKALLGFALLLALAATLFLRRI